MLILKRGHVVAPLFMHMNRKLHYYEFILICGFLYNLYIRIG